MYYIVVAENMSTSPTRPKTAAKAIDKRAEWETETHWGNWPSGKSTEETG